VIMRTCADSNLKKVSLELGGKSPLIIFDDCDLDRAVRMVGLFLHSFHHVLFSVSCLKLFVEQCMER